MPVKLHRCSNMWLRVEGHPCWRVQKALDEAGIEDELVKRSGLRRGKRAEYIELTGQKLLPAIELEDGTTGISNARLGPAHDPGGSVTFRGSRGNRVRVRGSTGHEG